MMKKYQTPFVEVLELDADKAIAGPVQSDPTLEDNDDDDYSV